MSEYSREQIKRKLENTLRVFKTSENGVFIEALINETLDKIGYNMIASATVNELRTSFKHQNFMCWNNILKLDYNKKYF